MPEASDTSAKRPSPRLRYSRLVSVGRPLGPQLTGMPFHRQLTPWPGSVAVARSKREVVGHEEVEVAVAVVVEKRAAGTPSRPAHRQAGGAAAILEPAVTAIAVQPVGAEGRDMDIDGAVVVVVAGADRRRPRRPAESGTLRDVGEGAVAPIAVHPRRRFATGHGGIVVTRAVGQARASEDDGIHPPVVVQIDPRDAGAVGLDDEALAIDAAVDRGVRSPARSATSWNWTGHGAGLAGLKPCATCGEVPTRPGPRHEQRRGRRDGDPAGRSRRHRC